MTNGIIIDENCEYPYIPNLTIDHIIPIPIPQVIITNGVNIHKVKLLTSHLCSYHQQMNFFVTHIKC